MNVQERRPRDQASKTYSHAAAHERVSGSESPQVSTAERAKGNAEEIAFLDIIHST